MFQRQTALVILGLSWFLGVSGQASFNKDFSANFDEVKQFGGNPIKLFFFVIYTIETFDAKSSFVQHSVLPIDWGQSYKKITAVISE